MLGDEGTSSCDKTSSNIWVNSTKARDGCIQRARRAFCLARLFVMFLD